VRIIFRVLLQILLPIVLVERYTVTDDVLVQIAPSYRVVVALQTLIPVHLVPAFVDLDVLVHRALVRVLVIALRALEHLEVLQIHVLRHVAL